MKIGLGCDHAGFELKEDIRAHLRETFPQHEIVDFGIYEAAPANYPEYGAKVGRAVASGEIERGIVFCGTGIGISMATGKVRGVRVALCHDEYSARMSRAHNDANVLALGGRVLGKGLARQIVNVWLETAFEGGRHLARVELIEALTKDN